MLSTAFWMQDDHRATTEAVGNALDSQPRQRNYCPSLFPAQWPLGRILGTTRRWLISGRFFTYKFGAHPRGTAALANGKLQLDNLIPGVSCEACHGPGEKHATAKLLETGADSVIFNPKTLDAETLSQEFCGACHRGVDSVAMMPDLGGINNVRFQPYRLFNSRGHDPKDPHLACTACHDPHLNLNQQDAGNDSHCKICHDPGTAAATLHVNRDNSAVAKRPGPSSPGRHCPVADEDAPGRLATAELSRFTCSVA